MKTKINFSIAVTILLFSVLVIQQACEKENDNEPGVSGDTFTDPRDGQAYKIVTIGSQTWFAQNLNYETSNSWCYDNNPDNCTKYGRLYTWEAAVDACPDGWHLPVDDEWKTMEAYLGMSDPDDVSWSVEDQDIGVKLKSESGWFNNGNGTNSSGFNALPGGARIGNEFVGIPTDGAWWTATVPQNCSYDGWMRALMYNTGCRYRAGEMKSHGYSVRCLKN